MTNTSQTSGKITLQDGQEANPIIISNAEEPTIPGEVENIELLVSVFDSLNTLSARLSRLDYLTKKYLNTPHRPHGDLEES